MKHIKQNILQFILSVTLAVTISACFCSTAGAKEAPKHIRQAATLSFYWNTQVNVAMFKRGNYLWLIFDKHHKFDVDEIAQQAKEFTDELVRMPHPYATIFRMLLKKDSYATLRNEGLLWIVDLFDTPQKKTVKDSQIFTEYDGLKHSYLFIPTTVAGEVISIIDPEVGDTMVIIPSLHNTLKLGHNYQYQDLDFLQSSQGLVFVPKADDIMVNKTVTGIAIKAQKRSLNISNNLDYLRKAYKNFTDEESSDGMFINLPPDAFKKDFNFAQTELAEKIFLAPTTSLKNNARLDLAKFYIGHGLGTNALGVLRQIKDTDTDLSTTEKFHALRGMANFLTQRYTEAVEDFSYGKLAANDEAILWKTIASSTIEFRKQDSSVIASFMLLLADYPQELRERLALKGLEIAIKAEDDGTAQKFMDILKVAQPNPLRNAEIHYLFGRYMEYLGYTQNSLAEFNKAAKSPSQKFSSLARKEIALFGGRFNFYTPQNVINEFEQLHFAWHESNFSRELLYNLIEIHLKQKDYDKVLETSQKLLDQTSDEEEKAQIRKTMVTNFEDVFVADGNNAMSPFKVLTIYENFGWLGKESKHYDTIVRKVVDRLVALDLLGRAQKLIDEQFKNDQLDLLEKNRLTIRMSLIKLFENKSKEALALLENSDNLPSTPALTEHRNLIKARAYADLGNPNKALELIKNNNSRSSTILKAELYWQAERWEEASQTIKHLIEPPVDGEPLSNEQIGYILDWIVTLKKAGKETILLRLHNKFLPFFKNTPYYSAFEVLTGFLETDKIDLPKIDKAISDVSIFSNFVKSYNASLRENQVND